MSVSNLLTREEFLALDHDARKEYLMEIRPLFPDKNIREFMGMKYNAWYMHLTSLGLIEPKTRDKGKEYSEQNLNRGGRKKGAKNKPKGDKGTNKDDVVPPKSSRIPTGTTVIEVEYEVVSDKSTQTTSMVAASAEDTEDQAKAVQSGAYLNFNIEDSPQNVHDRLKAIADLLKFEQGDLKLKIEVHRI